MIDAKAELSLLDAASLYAERGLYVTPVWSSSNGVCACPRGAACVSPGKHPVLDSWQTSASIDVMMLRDWFAPGQHNIGIVCSSSDICVIDIDPRNGGDAAFTALVAELGALPPTLTADSGGGGTHYVFRRPPGDLISKLGTGIDFLRDGRQFLVEPSVHPSGGHYRWRTGMAPDEIHIAALPDAWQKRVTRTISPSRVWAIPMGSVDSRIERARKYLAKIPGAVSGSDGHTATWNAVMHVMFGFDLDEAATLSIMANDFNPRCSPPWSEAELRHKIESCSKDCGSQRGYLLDASPKPLAPPIGTTAAIWMNGVPFHTDDKNKVINNETNTKLFITHHPAYAGKIRRNLMGGAIDYDGRIIDASIESVMRCRYEAEMRMKPSIQLMKFATAAVAIDNSFHPVRDYLRSIQWDGVPRLSQMAQTYLDSDSPMHATMVRRFLIGACARAMKPGCKLDHALMLTGKQGLYKSTFFKILASSEWFTDTAGRIGERDFLLKCHQSWIYEMSELESMVGPANESLVKGFMASDEDSFRPPYGADNIQMKRSFVVCGSTNHKEWLTDDTGSRRFWIIHVERRIPRELLAANRDQLWAEALCAYESGEQWHLSDEDDALREEDSSNFAIADSWTDIIGEWIGSRLRDAPLTLHEVMEAALKLEPSRMGWAEQRRAGKAMRGLGWVKKRVRYDGVLKWAWCRENAE